MDKSWAGLTNRRLESYQQGCVSFLEYAFDHAAIDGQIRCPCKDCRNIKYGDFDTVYRHLLFRGIQTDYGLNLWYFHNETETCPAVNGTVVLDQREYIDNNNRGEDMNELLLGCLQQREINQQGDQIPECDEFRSLIEDANTPLYKDCKNYTKLSFVIELYQIKSRGKMSDKTFSDTLQLLKNAFPFINVPESFYETKKLISKLGCGYKKIDACENDCMLFWKADSNLDVCRVCNSSRWKGAEQSPRKRITKKVLRHFPLIPRLQRLYMSQNTAKDMKWHAELRCDDGKLRHPADTDAWKELDKKHPLFASESRNVRLGLASDGFNPFGSLSSTYSTWPVILMVYNLPPGLCMQHSYMMMSLLISGSKGPKNSIDVYLQPLVDELNELWGQGVRTFDVSTNEKFNMRAALLWTINDFPAFGNLSGWSTSGYLACPSCAEGTVSERLWKSKKQCYMGHSRFPSEGAPPPPTGDDVLMRTEGINVTFGVGQPVHNDSQWRKRSIFFQLPYWKDNLIRHNLDVMHIEKNIGELLLKWLLNILDKSDTFTNAKEDVAKIKKPPNGNPGPRFPLLIPKLPRAHKVSLQDRKTVCTVIASIKVPNGYSSNISRCVQVDKIGGLKSHDYHVLLQQLLPLAVRNAGLPNKMATAIIDLCSFFRSLCSKTNTADDFKILHSQIVSIMCQLEKVFPPAFFVVMMHLPIHLAHEAMVAGPVHYRWMYPVERFLGHLKSFVRNKNCPEGSIAECYITEECLNFCAKYMDSGHEERGNEDECPGFSLFSNFGTLTNGGDDDTRYNYRTLMYDEMEKAHNYCLFNCPEIDPYIREHYEVIRNRVSTNDVQYKWKIQRLQDKEFRSWFRRRVEKSSELDEGIVTMAQSPTMKVRRYKSITVRGFKIRTKSSEEYNNTQNSGVSVNAATTSFASTKDNNPREGDITYYGVVKDIIGLSFCGGKKVVLLECDWADNLKKKIDSKGFTLLDFTRPSLNVNPFVLPSQILQTFYVQDPRDLPWVLPVVTRPRDDFDLRLNEATDDFESGCLDIFPIQTSIASSSNLIDAMEE